MNERKLKDCGGVLMETLITRAVAPWFGANRLLAEHVGEELAGNRWVGVPFAGGMSELATIDASVKILTNTIGNPYYVRNARGVLAPVVLGSYGLYVQRVRRTTQANGKVTTIKVPPTLLSPANEVAPPLKFNAITGSYQVS